MSASTLPDRIRGLAQRLPTPSADRLGPVTRVPWLLGLVAAAWAALIGLVLALIPLAIVWMVSQTGLGLAEAIRLGGLLWLVANGATVVIVGVAYSLLPWGLLLIPLLLLGYAGGWAVRRSGVTDLRGVALVVLPGAALYAGVGGLVAVLTAQAASAVDVLSAVVDCLVVALVALGFGALRASGLHRMHGIPWAGPVLRAATIAVATLVGAGAVAYAVSLLLHFDDAVTMAQSLHGGLWGGLGLFLMGLCYVPVAAVWGTSYLLGAGIVLGPGAMASPFIGAASPATLPPFPLLAGVPQGSTPLGWLLPVVGILSGVFLGVAVLRAARAQTRLVRVLLAGAAAAVAGAALAVLALLSSGALGNDRLAHVGPSPMTVGVLAAVLLILGAVPTVTIPGQPGRRRKHLAVAEAGLGAAEPAETAVEEEQLPADAPLA